MQIIKIGDIMKKGFTLVEMLAVIVILALLVILVIPAVSNIISNSRTRLYDVQIKNIELAAKNWGAENVGMLPSEEGGSITIYLYNLKMGGFIEDDILDPLSGEEFPNDIQIEITRERNSFKYFVLTDTGTPGGITGYDEIVIILIGATEDTVEINSGFPGVGPDDIVAYAADGTIIANAYISITITENGSPVGSVDVTGFNDYEILYEVNFGGKSASVERTLEVVDTTPPELIVPPETTISAAECNAPYDLETDILVSDNSGSYNLEINGSLNCTAPSTNVIEYVATDASDNETIRERTIYVE